MPLQRNIGISFTSFKADADYSAACAQYKFVSPASTYGNVIVATGASNPAPIGVLVNSPSQNHAAEVSVLGTVWVGACVNACILRPGRFITVGSHGYAEPVATAGGSPVCGRWVGPSVSSGSAIGEAIFFGMTACHVSSS